jgi:hypothetical protein
MIHRELADRIDARAAANRAAKLYSDPALDALYRELQEKQKDVEAGIAAAQGSARPRAMFLSATPFAYEKTIDWADGYLFDYGPVDSANQASRGYNGGDDRDRFFMQHFGYRMRYNKLTEPDEKVDRGLMQRQFNTWLKKNGVLSTRVLDVDQDYDRRFVLVDSKIGNRIDALLEWARDTEGLEPAARDAKRHIGDTLREKFDHLSRRYLLEAIKAEASVDYVRKALALGRKVVVFHDFKKGGGFNPFKFDVDDVKANAAEHGEEAIGVDLSPVLDEYNEKFGDLINSDIGSLRSPIETYKAEFPDVLIFNGDVPPKKRRVNVAEFNDDGSGPRVMLVQSAAGKEGISLHDTTGKHKRVLLNLGLPTQPTTAIQQEGRIYRVGQQSDAAFRYFNTGTSWEKWAFATTIAQRASAAENLAVGEQARALKDAFIAAFEEADDYPPGMEGEGTGGKERDRASNEALDDFDRAVAFYWGTEKKTARTKEREGRDYYATPEPVGLKMVEWAGVRPSEKVLEPSAGHGAIARWIPSTADATAVEPSTELASRLAMVFDGAIKQQRFEDLHAVNKYDAIVMNPPFGHGGSTAIEHLNKAVNHLRDGGRVVALIPTGPAADAKFEKWHENIPGVYLEADIRLPNVTFERAATKVAARIVVLDKMDKLDDWSRVATQSPRELTGINDVNELFARVRNMEVPERPQSLKPAQPEAQPAAPAAPSAPAGTLEAAQTKHSKTGADLYVAKVVGRVPREQYLELAAAAKANGGYWSSFKGGGAIPGFQFKTAEARDKFMAAAQPAQTGAEGSFSLGDEQTDTPEFKKWFGKSKIVDEKGNPLVVYHGTDAADFAAFSADRWGGFKGIYFAKNPGLAGVYAEGINKFYANEAEEEAANQASRPRVIPAYLRIENPKIIDSRTMWEKLRRDTSVMARDRAVSSGHLTPADIAKYQEQGYDGIVNHDYREIVAFEPTQIKSAIGNRGTFDPNNPDIAFSLGRGDRARVDASLADLQKRLAEVGISDKVALKLVPYIVDKDGVVHAGARGYYIDRVINIAAYTGAKKRTLNHELIHALRDLGVIRGAEWRVLEKAAHADTALMDSVRRRYGRLNLSEDKLTEEGVADLHAAYAAGELKPNGFVKTALDRINRFLEAVRNWWQGDGFQSARDIFERINSGEMGARPSRPSMYRPGAFSLGDEDQPTPRFNPRAAAVREALDGPIPDTMLRRFFDEAVFRFQDKFNYLAKAQKSAAAARGVSEMKESEDPYLAELRYHGMAGAAIEDFQREHVEPLVKAISESGLKIEDIDSYLLARHAPEANAQLKKINPDREDNEALSGMSDAEAQSVVDGFRRSGKLAALEKVADRVDAITKAQRELLVSSGLERPETIAKWQQLYKHYVPLHREGFDTASPGRGQGFSVAGRGKRRAGSNRTVAHVAAQLVAQMETTIVRAEKNKVSQALLNFAKANKNPELYTVDKVEFKPSFDSEGLVTYRPTRGFAYADNVVVAKVNGADHTITFNERNRDAARIAYAMKNLGAEHSGSLVNALTKVTRFLALVNTGANPEFIISNFARDLQTAGYNLSSTDADGLKWKIIRDVGKAWRGIRSFQKRNGKNVVWADHFDRFRKAGAQTGWMEFYSGIAAREKKLVAMVNDLRGNSRLLDIKRGLRAVEQFIEHENTAVENAIRLSAFVHATEAGISEAQAAKIAKELTVNFNRKGDYGQAMNALYLFYNAGIQGSARLIAAAAKSRKVRLLMGATIVTAMALDILNRAIGGTDPDDDKDRYDKIPDYVKERNLIIMLPDGKGDYLKVPLPWGYNVLHVLGQVMGEALTKRGFKATDGASRVFGSAFSAFNPLGSEASILQMISPTLTDPLVQWAENKDWTGRKLHPDQNSFDVPKPMSQMYFNSVREPSKWIAQELNELTGGNEVRPGSIDISPAAIDLVIDTFTGGAGKFLSDTLSTPIKALEGDDLESYEVPLVRKVYGLPGMGDLTSEYYDHADAVRLAENEYKHYAAVDRQEALKLREQNADVLRLAPARSKIEEELTKLRQQRRRVDQSQLSDADKKARDEQINREMRTLMQRFNKLYNEHVKP